MTMRCNAAGVTSFYGPGDGNLTFPKFTIHEFGRADNGGDVFDPGDTVIEEWVTAGKEAFTPHL